MTVWPFYAGLSLVACAAAWRDPDVRPIGVALVASVAASNAAHWWLGPLERPPAYTVAEVMVLSMAFIAHVCAPSRMLVALVAVSIVSIGLNIHMTLTGVPTLAQVRAWEVCSNICFSVECGIVLTMGLYDRSRARVADRGASAALYGRAPNQSKAER
jgi:hypothetical protein